MKTPTATPLGERAPTFSLPDLDGSTVTLESAMGPKGLIVAFICNHCPYVKAIADDLAKDATILAKSGVHTVAIMPNDYARYPADAPPKMRAFAEAHGFSFPYVLDESQDVAKSYGAACTPEFYGLDKDGVLRYHGRLDDGGARRSAERVPELVHAMRKIADGAEPPPANRAMGCSIKWR
ncbi:MAG: thioredoxin family protein [Myxococcota bacterium]